MSSEKVVRELLSNAELPPELCSVLTSAENTVREVPPDAELLPNVCFVVTSEVRDV